ncbi:MAG: metal-sensitive transcriptional regulator [Anaerolineaceae bacterium]|jgi:DNA-binding FrmR family transcriptional regulator
MNYQDPLVKQKVILRLRRIEGQVRGVQAMVDQERDCQEVLQQLQAIRSAVYSTSLVILKEYMNDCLLNQVETDPSSREELVDELISMLAKTEA